MKNLYKILVFIIIMQLLNPNVISSNNTIEDKSNEIKSNILDSNIKIYEVETSFYIIMPSGKKTIEKNITIDICQELIELFKKYYDNPAENAELIELLYKLGYIPNDLTIDEFIKILTPPWYKNKYNFNSNFINKISTTSSSGTSFFCSIASGGNGRTYPLVLLPRPRLVHGWRGYSDYDLAITTVGKVNQERGFIAYGGQNGFTIGFVGIGMTFASPFGNAYGLLVMHFLQV